VSGLKSWQASTVLGVSGDAGGLTPMPLKLRELAPSASAATRTSRARYAPSSAADAATLRMGMTAQVQLRQPGRASGAELPVGALLMTGTGSAASSAAGTAGPAVWQVDPATGALNRQPVQLIAQTTDHVRVAGLPDGALVVSVGAQKLDAGMTVRAVTRPLPAPITSVAAR
jgi:membrane fusion protein, multidrug efflux system